MIFRRQKGWFIFQDAVYSIARGLVTGIFNRFLSLFLYKGKSKIFIKDITVSLVFALVLYSYIISFTNYKVLRWYNVLFALIGLNAFNPIFDNMVRIIIKIATVTAKYGLSKVICKLKAKTKYMLQKNKKKSQKIPQKNSPELLKEQADILYN